MSLLSGIRNRISDAVHDAEKAAADAAARAKEAITSNVETAKEKARAVAGEPPPPAPASVAHAQAAAADAARNSTPTSKTKAPETTVFAGFGASAAGGTPDSNAGGQISAGYAVGAQGSMKKYGTTGRVEAAAGVAAGVGFEAGVVGDMRDLYGEGHQLTVAFEALSVNLLLTPENDVAGVSIAGGKSIGFGAFYSDTHTTEE